jgi:hypothetical protein
MIRVGGLDPALSTTGVAWPDGTFSTLRPPALPTRPKGEPARCVDRARRLQDIERLFVVEARRHPPTAELWMLEGYSMGGARGYAAAYTAEGGGVLRLRLVEVGAREILEIPPSRLKKYATGDGGKKTDKAAMLAAAIAAVVRPRGVLFYLPTNHDEADAFWLRQLGVDLVAELEGTYVPVEEGLEQIRAEIRGHYAGAVRGLRG